MQAKSCIRMRREEVYSKVSGSQPGSNVGHKLPEGVGHLAGGNVVKGTLLIRVVHWSNLRHQL
jgi:hypothetical protein